MTVYNNNGGGTVERENHTSVVFAVVNCRCLLSSLSVTFVVMLIVVFKIDPPPLQEKSLSSFIVVELFIFVVMQIVVFKIAPLPLYVIV